ncbi:hypothetical protein D0862_03659 [Hortaea werneckii]|uniref:RPEL repeat protein n=1 Tax=Hortaea werneckii TaxID=91943 RepID=A0A3M7H8C4_HORWE|nr:hypothetical protein D0862_03659 [Hortaea werneckii]
MGAQLGKWESGAFPAKRHIHIPPTETLHHPSIFPPILPNQTKPTHLLSIMATQHPIDPTSTTEHHNNGTVDRAPITNTLERRNSLEKALQQRPDEQDLKDRHILLDTTAAPALQAKAAELERQRVMDNLRKVGWSGWDG